MNLYRVTVCKYGSDMVSLHNSPHRAVTHASRSIRHTRVCTYMSMKRASCDFVENFV